MRLIVGLGNPGEKYEGTRHNLGFTLLDEYARKHLGPQISWQVEKKFQAETLKIDNDLWLIKPQTFMNNSGISIKALASYFKIPSEEIIIIHDDLDLNLGQIKIRMGGAAGGHHGVESVISILEDDKFVRMRLGIGLPEGAHVSVEQFVLEPFVFGERAKVKQMIKRGVEALDLLLNEGLKIAQNQYN